MRRRADGPTPSTWPVLVRGRRRAVVGGALPSPAVVCAQCVPNNGTGFTCPPNGPHVVCLAPGCARRLPDRQNEAGVHMSCASRMGAHCQTAPLRPLGPHRALAALAIVAHALRRRSSGRHRRNLQHGVLPVLRRRLPVGECRPQLPYHRRSTPCRALRGGGGAAKLMARLRANSMPPRAEWGRCVPPDFVDEMPVLPAGPNGAFRGNDFEFQCRQPARLAFTLTHRRGWCVLSHAAAQPWRHARARLGGAPSWQYSPTTCVRTT